MDNRSILVLFFTLIVVFVFSFTLSLDAIANNHAMYGIYAFIGFLILIALSLFQSLTLGKDGVSLAYWFRVLCIVSLITFVWYSTRIGTLFKWW